MTMNRFIVIFPAVLISFFILSCNPVYEDISEQSWDSNHNSKPFQSEFFHGADYRFPVNSCNEVQCHSGDLTGGNSGGPSCYSCHDDQWTVFSVSHTRKISGYYHRSDVDEYPADRNSNVNWFSSCGTAACHGATLDGNQGAPSADFAYRYSCKSCHAEFSGIIPPPGHSKSKDSKWHHFRYESADEDGGSGNVTYCSGSACHGSDGKSSVSASGLFGRSPACSECH